LKILIFLTFLYSLLLSDSIELNLKQFAELVSNQHKINILINDDVKSSNYSFYLYNNKSRILLSAFRKMLELKKLQLNFDQRNNFYYIDKIKKKKHHLRTIHLDTLVYKDFEPILANFKDIKYSYLKNTNSIVINSTKADFKEIKEIVKENDSKRDQFLLKITVVETNLRDVKERGVNLNLYTQSLSGDNQYFIDLITAPFNAQKNIFESSKVGLSASLKFLDDNGFSRIEASPFQLVQSGKEIKFSAVENIPYKSSSSEVNGASQSNTEQITYKDVGLKVTVLPNKINDVVYIDLDFVIETILDKTSLTPSTAKRTLKNSFQLRAGQLLVLSGLIQNVKDKSIVGVPLLKDIPWLGYFFSYENINNTQRSLSLMIEIIEQNKIIDLINNNKNEKVSEEERGTSLTNERSECLASLL
jgi:general secretion pathway protein D